MNRKIDREEKIISQFIFWFIIFAFIVLSAGVAVTNEPPVKDTYDKYVYIGALSLLGFFFPIYLRVKGIL